MTNAKSVTLVALFRTQTEAEEAVNRLARAGFTPAEIGVLVPGDSEQPDYLSGIGDQALYYLQEVRSGRSLVTVTTPRTEEARGVLQAAAALEVGKVGREDRPLSETDGR